MPCVAGVEMCNEDDPVGPRSPSPDWFMCLSEEQEMASTRGKSLWEKLAKSKLKNNKLLLTVEQQLMISTDERRWRTLSL